MRYTKNFSKFLGIVLVLMMMPLAIYAQKTTVKGTVSDVDGPLVGATVKVKGATVGTVTDLNGNYSISANPGQTLEISYLGYLKKEIKVGKQSNVNVTLEQDGQSLNEVVVIGYGVQKKSDLTGAVASVKGGDIENLSTPDAGAALQGKVAGVQIINSGSPGAGAEIRVRGYSSNSTSSQGPLLIVDGLKVDNIQYLDPSMIESMEVLKDAASAAIYGAQAGNGVILITTKTGSKGTARVSYSLKAANQSLGKKAEIFNAADYIDYQKYIGMLTDERLTQNNYNGQDTDWYDEVFGNSWSVQHNVTVEGGNDKGHFLAGIGYLNNDGIVRGDKDVYKRFSGQINADYQIYKWLNVKTSNNFEKWSTRSISNGYQSMLNSVVSIDPLTPAYVYSQDDMGIGMKNQWNMDNHGTPPVLTPPSYTDENPVWYGTSKYAQDATGNPLGMRDRSNAESSGVNVRGSVEANLTPVKGLTVTSRLGYRIAQSNSHDSATPWWLNNKNAKSTTYSISAATNASLYYQWENFVNYMNTFGKHTVGAMVGMSYTKDHYDNSSISSSSNDGPVLNGDGASNFNYIDYLNDNGKANLTVSNAPADYTSLSYFGRLSYNYDNRYFFQFNIRRDAFDLSKLSKDARWGTFPSFSAGWTLSNEEFFKNAVSADAVSFLKLRGSWGRNGNVAPLSGYQYASTIGIGGYYQFNPGTGTLTTGGAPGKMANPDLSWETSEQLDFGLDARFLNDRLLFGFDWYRKTTKDLLVQVTGIPEIGGQSQWVNTGKVLNTGVDIELGWRDHVGDFKYSVMANFSPLKNEVQEVSSVYPRITETGISGFNNKMQPTFEKGHQVWYFRGWKYAGVYNENLYSGTTFDKANVGKALYYDQNGELTMSPTDDDKQDLGSGIPKFTYGITVNLEYKGFDFTLFGTGAAGNKIYNLMVSADTPETNGLNVYWKNSWRSDESGNVIATGKYPDMKYVSTDWIFYSSDAALFSGSYFKFKQIQLGYTLPSELTKKFYVNNLRFSVSLDDFFTITSYPGADPETSSLNSGASRGYDNGNYPMSKKIVFGVNLTF